MTRPGFEPRAPRSKIKRATTALTILLKQNNIKYKILTHHNNLGAKNAIKFEFLFIQFFYCIFEKYDQNVSLKGLKYVDRSK